MKLYYSAGACSLASHIVMYEAGLVFEAIAAPTKTHQLADGTDYYTINPLGYVPFLVLDDGRTLRETAAILQYLADQAPSKKLAPAAGSFERYQLQEWLHFIGTELHKSHSPLFTPGTPAEYKPMVRSTLMSRFEWINAQLADKAYLMGEFSVADAYLYNVSRWGQYVSLDLSGLSHLVAFQQRMEARPGVQAALRAEGLIK